jgi:hypothetical protein
MDDNINTSKLKSIICHPVYGSLGFIVGIIGIGVGVFFGMRSIASRKLTFSVYPVRTTVVKSGEASVLSVFANQEKIDSDITAVQVSLWNSGKLEIEKDDILEPVLVYTEPKVRILEASIKKASRDIINLQIRTDRFSSGEVPISWNIFEKNDGGIVQIIYSGDAAVRFNLRGTIKGQSKIISFTPSTQANSLTKTMPKGLLKAIFLAYLFTGILVLFSNRYATMLFSISTLMFREDRTNLKRAPSKRSRIIFSSVFIITSLVVLFFLLYGSHQPEVPPFG